MQEGMTANNDDDNIEIINGVVGGTDEDTDTADGKSLTDLVEQPAKVMRIGTMIKQLLEEVRAAPLDDASRNRLREIHRTSIRELEDGLAPELRDELERLTLPFTEDGTPSDAELRIAQAQLVGWLEGLFHGIQTALFAQQMAARQQLEQMRQGALPPGVSVPGQRGGGTGQYIETRNAWVEFPIFDAKTRSLKKAFLGKAGGAIGRNESNVVVIEALRDITMSLELGDRVGLVGHNGAGKSTLLRLLSGIYEPTRGVASVTGRVAPVFDLGVGMDPEISGFENIIIRGLFLGQTRKQMLAKVDEIAEFTELGDYLSMPLRTYSTGMRVRLAMGVVTSIDPEILLLDEGIGAVDAEFLKKAQTRLQSLVERSGILVFASHSNEFLARLCKTAMWIDHGTVKMTGGIEDVVRAYEGDDAARHVREVLEENAREGA
jgi:ABC-2 type transport system ATP-binding protein